MTLSKRDLLEQVLQAVRDTGATAWPIKRSSPFVVSIQKPQEAPCELRIFLWNCTPGGKGRAPDEFRVQVTKFIAVDPSRPTLMLGWHEPTRTFAAWDTAAHEGQTGDSPSAQIKEDTLRRAREHGFATQVKTNEIVFAFRPEFFVDYAFGASTLHAAGARRTAIPLLNSLEGLSDAKIDTVTNSKRRKVLRQIATNYRSAKFRGQVLDAYAHACAFCGVQLSLIDAAHILPVSAPDSTDEIENGIALCKLHHYAYDANLLSFNERYEIQVSATRLRHLKGAGQTGGVAKFRTGLRKKLLLPVNPFHHPSQKLIKRSRVIRGWLP